MNPVSTSRRGYILMEVMLAAGIFALAGVGLALALNDVAKTFIGSRKATQVRMELSSRLAEARLLPLAPQITRENPDAHGITYEKEVATLDLKKTNPLSTLNTNEPLEGLFRLTITAHWLEGKNLRDEKAEVYVYQP